MSGGGRKCQRVKILPFGPPRHFSVALGLPKLLNRSTRRLDPELQVLTA
jgi:hypothetical protein